MKLVKCTPYAIRSKTPSRGGPILTFVRLETDNGIVGWGEAHAQGAFNNTFRSYVQLMNDLFDVYLKGEDALAREKIMKKMYMRFSAIHPDMMGMSLFSAFDIALWDIAGKAYNMPVYQMLGGKFRDKVRCYTYIYDADNFDSVSNSSWNNAEWVTENALKFVEKGYDALKFDPIRTLNRNGYPPSPWELPLEELENAERSVSMLREKLGNKVDILIGTHGQLTTASAIRLGKMLEKYFCFWFEEPVPPENTKEMGKVVRAVTVPVATGERLVNIFEFQRLFEDSGCAIIQPDLGTAGGITEVKKIAAMAEAKYTQVAPHLYAGPVNLAAAVQMDTAIPNFVIQEAVSAEGNPFFNSIVDEPLKFENGYVYPTDRPGIGLNLIESELEKHLAF